MTQDSSNPWESNHREAQALYDKHTLLQFAEERNRKQFINMDVLVTVQAKDSREGSNIILNRLEMKVAQQPDIYEDHKNNIIIVLAWFENQSILI